ncbi:MAG TPA: LytTR family DNA-binding domain-containing protein [Bacillota bacterium]|nr:LytTR family DNA-binding domain-containing protein [Bacillota bacterium]
MNVMELRVLLVDDNEEALMTLKRQLQSYPYIRIVEEFHNGNDAIHFLIENNHIDLILLDIEMNGINGLDVAHHINSMYPDVLVIFTTGHSGFALDGYEADPVDFLTKPIDDNRLEQALQKAQQIKYPKIKRQTNERIGLKVAKGIQIIEVRDILYIEKKGRSIFLHTIHGDKIKSSDTMQNLEAIFIPFEFYRPHQSFIVPIEQIRGIFPDTYSRSYTIDLANSSTKIPLSRSKYAEFKNILEEKMEVH